MAHVCQTLREAAPGLRLVITSQAPLRLAAERVYRIGPLAVPQGPLPAAQALEFGAVALFTERAQAVDARFVLTDANAPAVIEVCRALDGLALAIELAAARAPMLGAQRLAASMHDRLKLLNTSRNRTAPARQQTLCAALDWSHDLLDAREQAVFRRLGVMAGSASLELIRQVVADPVGTGELDEWTVLDALGVLVDRSLVALLSTDDGDAVAPRYRLLDSPRVYALERLAAAGEQEVVKRRHALAMAAYFDAAWDELYDGSIGHDDWLRRMSFDLDNAREAFAWAGAAGDVQSALAIGTTLWDAMPPSMYAERLALAGHCEALLSPAAPGHLQLRAWLLLCPIHRNAQRQRGHDAAQRAVSLARALLVKDRDPFTLYLSLSRFATTAVNVGDADAATAALVEMGALEDPAWPPHRLLARANAEAFVASSVGNAADALLHTRWEEALHRARGSLESQALVNLIDYELAAGDAAAAVRSGTELVAILESGRDEFNLNFARLNLTGAWLPWTSASGPAA